MARAKNQTRVYVVKRGDTETLVSAASRATAISHVIKDVSATIATQDQIIAVLTSGGKIEYAAEPAEPAESAEPAEPAESAEPAKPAEPAESAESEETKTKPRRALLRRPD